MDKAQNKAQSEKRCIFVIGGTFTAYKDCHVFEIEEMFGGVWEKIEPAKFRRIA